MIKLILIILGLCILSLICMMIYIGYTQTSTYQGPVSDHFDGKVFYNRPPYRMHNFTDIWRWRLTANKIQWPEHVANTAKPDLTAVTGNQVKVTFVNHASMLIQTEKYNLLTDPIWSNRASPVTWLGPHRVREPGVPFDQLPKIDVVMVSHNHYDHLDLPTLTKLHARFHPVFLVPLGMKDLLMRNGIQNVVEMDWWQTFKNAGLVITFMPTQHWSARWLNDKFQSLWGSYGMDIAGHKIYFAGDVGYSQANFSLIQQQWGKPDLAFLPIGSYKPEWFMQSNHMNPQEALKAHQDLGAKQSIGMHFGTFQLSDEGIDEPVIDLQKALNKQPELEKQFIVLQVGESKLF